MTVQDAVDQYLASLAAEQRSPHTVNAYRRDLRAFTTFTGDLKLDDVHARVAAALHGLHHVQVRACGTQRAKATINRYRVTLKALFAVGGREVARRAQSSTILKCRRYRALPPEVLTDEEVERVITFSYKGKHADRDRALLTFMLTTGCRLGETVALNCGDVDLVRKTATLRSTKGVIPTRTAQ